MICEPENYWCEQCGKPIYEGDEYYDIDDHTVCIDCALDFLDEKCKEINGEGETVYIVNDYEWGEDELNSLLRCRLRVKEIPDEDYGNPEDEPEYKREREDWE